MALTNHNKSVFPIWYVYQSVAVRDARLWVSNMLVEGAQKNLGMLAGLNQRYFTTFQLKRMRDLIESFEMKPSRLVDRVEFLLRAEHSEAVIELESLTAETFELVRKYAPAVDLSGAGKKIGARQSPWK